MTVEMEELILRLLAATLEVQISPISLSVALDGHGRYLVMHPKWSKGSRSPAAVSCPLHESKLLTFSGLRVDGTIPQR